MKSKLELNPGVKIKDGIPVNYNNYQIGVVEDFDKDTGVATLLIFDEHKGFVRRQMEQSRITMSIKYIDQDNKERNENGE